jgi:hypothetical protein
MRLFCGSAGRVVGGQYCGLFAARGMAIKRHKKGSRTINTELPSVTTEELDRELKRYPINEDCLTVVERDEHVVVVAENGGVLNEKTTIAKALLLAREMRLDMMLVASVKGKKSFFFLFHDLSFSGS